MVSSKRPWRPRNVPKRPPFYSRSPPTVLNSSKQSVTPRPSSPTSQDLTRPATTLSRPPTDFTRPFQTIKVGRGRPPSRLSVKDWRLPHHPHISHSVPMWFTLRYQNHSLISHLLPMWFPKGYLIILFTFSSLEVTTSSPFGFHVVPLRLRLYSAEFPCCLKVDDVRQGNQGGTGLCFADDDCQVIGDPLHHCYNLITIYAESAWPTTTYYYSSNDTTVRVFPQKIKHQTQNVTTTAQSFPAKAFRRKSSYY